MITSRQQSRSFGQRIQFRNWPIAVKLVVIILLHALVPLLIATYVTTQISTDALSSEMKISLSRLASGVSRSTQQNIDSLEDSLRTITTNQSVQTYLVSPDDNLTSDIQDLITAASSDASVDEVAIYDKEGNALFHTKEDLIDQNFADKAYIQAALAGKPFVSEPYFDPKAVQPAMDIALPIRKHDNANAANKADSSDTNNATASSGTATPQEDNGEVIGVAWLRMSLDYVDFLLADNISLQTGKVGQQGNALSMYAVNRDGLIVAHSEDKAPSRYSVLGTLDETVRKQYVAAGALGEGCPDGGTQCDEKDQTARTLKEMPALQPLADQVKAAFINKQAGSFRYCRPNKLDEPASSSSDTCNGEWYLASFVPYQPSNTDKPVFVAVSDIQESAILQSVDQQRKQNMLIAAIIAPLALLASLLVARTFAHRINKLASMARDIELGQAYDPQVIRQLSGSTDEIGNLSRVFDEMVTALRARMDELATIYQIGQEISSSVELDETLRYVLRSIRQAIPYDWAELCLVDEEKKQLNVKVAADHDSIEEVESTPYAMDQGYSGRLIQQGAGLLVANVETFSAIPMENNRTWKHLTPKAYIGVPLKNKEKVIGTIEMISTQPNGFSTDNLRVLESIANQATVAVQNAQQVQVRENKLKQVIYELRIEIDENKKTREVTAITESEYFNDLQSKLKEMRQRKRGEKPNKPDETESAQ